MAGKRRLIGNVMLHVDGLPTHYGPDGAVPPPEVAKLIGEHLWETVEDDTQPPPTKPAKVAAKKAAAKPTKEPDTGNEDGEDRSGDDDGGGSPDEVTLPTKGGVGSGVSKWVAYAAANGVTVPDGASRDDIIAACAAAGVPTE